jgi:hypothetical protein
VIKSKGWAVINSVDNIIIVNFRSLNIFLFLKQGHRHDEPV